MQETTLDFLKKLKKNNNREWFHANRELYDAALDDMSEVTRRLIQELTKQHPELKGLQPKDALFRIFRDVRFAKDKSPYKTNFGANIAPGGRKAMRPGYYIHIEPGESMVAGGLYMPPAPVLQKVRELIAAKPDELRKILKAKKFKETFGDLQGEQLKNVPRGFDREHPAADLLKFKSYIVWTKLTDSEVLGSGLEKKVLGHFKTLKPLIEYLDRAVK